MSKVIFVRGIPASGKSTWAKAWVLEDPENRIRISWDDIRRMLGKYWVPSRENIVKQIGTSALLLGLMENKDIVIDNMNLSQRSIEPFLSALEGKGVTIEYMDFKTPLEECLRRDALRQGDEQIGADVITNIYNRNLDFYSE